MKKQNVLDALNDLPKEFPLDELLERLIVVEKIDKGLQDIKEGELVSHEAAKKWLTNKL